MSIQLRIPSLIPSQLSLKAHLFSLDQLNASSGETLQRVSLVAARKGIPIVDVVSADGGNAWRLLGTDEGNKQ